MVAICYHKYKSQGIRAPRYQAVTDSNLGEDNFKRIRHRFQDDWEAMKESLDNLRQLHNLIYSLVYSVEKLDVEVGDFSALILMRGLHSG